MGRQFGQQCFMKNRQNWFSWMKSRQWTAMVCPNATLIKLLRQEKGWNAKWICSEFCRKKWVISSVNNVLWKIYITDSVECKVGNWRPRSVRTQCSEYITFPSWYAAKKTIPAPAKVLKESRKLPAYPVDYAVWRALQRSVYGIPLPILDDLEERVHTCRESFNQHLINKSIDQWHIRLKAVVQENGGVDTLNNCFEYPVHFCRTLLYVSRAFLTCAFCYCVRNDMTICNLDGVNPLDRNSWRTSVRRCQVLPTPESGTTAAP